MSSSGEVKRSIAMYCFIESAMGSFSTQPCKRIGRGRCRRTTRRHDDIRLLGSATQSMTRSRSSGPPLLPFSLAKSSRLNPVKRWFSVKMGFVPALRRVFAMVCRRLETLASSRLSSSVSSSRRGINFFS